MRRFAFRALLTALALAIAGIAVVAQPFEPNGQVWGNSMSVRMTSWVGQVIDADEASGTVTVTSPMPGGGNVVLKIADDTTISGAGPGGYNDLKVGAQVTVKGHATQVASSDIQVGPPPPDSGMEIGPGGYGVAAFHRAVAVQIAGEGGDNVMRMLNLDEPARPATGAAVAIQGAIASRDPLTIETEEGDLVRVDIEGDAKVTRSVQYNVGDLLTGDTLQISALEADDGSMTAKSLVLTGRNPAAGE